MRACVFTAGNGTRLRPLTDRIPKPMVRVNGKPVLEYLVEYLNSYGITEIIVNLHYKPQQIYKYFGDRLIYSYEPKLLGEEKTEEVLQPWLGDEYILMNGDTLTDLDLNDLIHDARNGDYSAIYSWDEVYTGLTYKRMGVEMGHYIKPHKWIDIGTPKNLKKARQEWK